MFMVGVAQTITTVETAAADQILISGQMMQKNNTRRKKSHDSARKQHPI